ncbi:hypothetical protein [Clostridium sp. DMHC 10]|uniref:hypothetical protein n=1 Tax=Clostridium sp. DMHC 10 TaxID=747377 RepID=UPI00069DAE20|nr:hypothetical protein [Clostridium sp. DMHC 10]
MNNFVNNPMVSDGEPGMEYIGRFDFSESDGPVFGWSCSTIVAKFIGTKVFGKISVFWSKLFYCRIR